jgi:Domain of unknown function (DUF6249)
MKTSLSLSLCSIALALVTYGQTSPPSATTPAAASPPVNGAVSAPAAASPVATVAPAASAAPTIAPSAAPDNDEDFDRAIERKINKHFRIDFDGKHGNHSDNEDQSWIALVVFIACTAVFGTPIAIVGLILYFSFSRSRAMHKTVRMMVEKGQPVPEALLNPPPVVRQRSDLRRGIILLSVGAGLMVLLGALNDWEGGAWSLGFIPFIIGLGYLLVWRLDVHKEEASTKV